MKLADALVLCNAGLPQPATYNRLLGLVHQGVVPAYRNQAGTRWEVSPDAIPEIQAALRGDSTPAEPEKEFV